MGERVRRMWRGRRKSRTPAGARESDLRLVHSPLLSLDGLGKGWWSGRRPWSLSEGPRTREGVPPPTGPVTTSGKRSRRQVVRRVFSLVRRGSPGPVHEHREILSLPSTSTNEILSLPSTNTSEILSQGSGPKESTLRMGDVDVGDGRVDGRYTCLGNQRLGPRRTEGGPNEQSNVRPVHVS